VSFLPLVQRELRAATRRKGVFWLRPAIVVAALLCILPAVFAASFRPNDGAGTVVFLWLSWLSFLVCVLAGAFFASDCISRERREGTLGFLFLTDLRGYDVVLGKFCAVSLNAFYSLLAIFPVLGLSLLGGGVTFAEFWRMSLALLNALFFAVALALCVSARSRAGSPPAIAVLGLLLIVIVGGVVGASLPGAASYLSVPTFANAFLLAPAATYLYHQKDFWRSLAVSNAIGWLLLALAAWRLEIVRDAAPGPLMARLRRRRRRALLEANPVVWLLDDSSAVRTAARVIGVVGAFCTVAAFRLWPTFFFYGAAPFYFLLKVLCAVQACRFFAECRGNGAFELLGATPLERKDMIAGQWAALRRVFLPPFCLLVASHIVACVAWEGFLQGAFSMVGLIWQVLTQIVGFLAIGWFGMWMALSLRLPSRAAFITILACVVGPMVVLCVPNLGIYAILVFIAQAKVSHWSRPRSRPWEIEPRFDWPVVRS